MWIGDADGVPPHWGGGPRQCVVRGVAELSTGHACWLVTIRPALPAVGGAGVLSEAVLAVRYSGDEMADIAERPVPVRVCRVLAPLGPSGRFGDGDLVIDYWADAAASENELPTGRDSLPTGDIRWQRIERFIDMHGHSCLPDPYFDEDGRLDILVGNIRWHHAGNAGVSPGPFPGVDYGADLDPLEGWSWEPHDGG